MLRGALIAALLAGCSNTPGGNPCSTDADCENVSGCEDGCHCQGGQCIDGLRACGAALPPCPEGQSCCSGFCSDTICCGADFECADGFCANGRCQSGERGTCAEPDDCTDGACLVTVGRCVECIYSDDCPRADLYCSPAHACEPAGAGCTPAECAASGDICGAEGICRDCVSNGECGDRICQSGTCAPCTTPDSCGLGRVCDDGACVNEPDIPCTTNAECGGRICFAGSCVPCSLPTECGPEADWSCVDGLCIPADPDCTTDSECSPPQTICQAGLCSPGCTPGSCGANQACSPTTGRCSVVSSGTEPLGAPCSSHDVCQSGVCWAGIDETTGNPVTWCSKACTLHDDCPSDFVCFELGDGNACVDKALFGLPLDVPPGGACTGPFLDTDCMTGYCDTGRGECMEMCGRDDDCADLGGGRVCVSRWPIGVDANNDGVLTPAEITGFTQLCYPPLPETPANACDPNIMISGVGLDPGQRCVCHDDCKHGYCAQSPDYSLEPRCAEPCCTPHDCDPSRSVCKPLSVWDGIYDSVADPYGFQKACLWREYDGEALVGEPCEEDDDCRSEICVAGPSGIKRCTHTCCTDRDCAVYDWASSCRPPFDQTDPPHPVADANAADIELSLGRWAITSAGVYRTQASGMLCMPR